MDLSDLSLKLDGRNSIISSCSDWNSAVLITESLIPLFREERDLGPAVRALASETTALEQHLKSNNEATVLINEMKSLESEIREKASRRQSLIDQEAQINADIMRLKSEAEPLESLNRELSQKRTGLQSELDAVQAIVVKRDLERISTKETSDSMYVLCKTLLDQNADLEVRLFASRSREADLMNAANASEPHTPSVDISAITSPLPMKSVSRPSDLIEIEPSAMRTDPFENLREGTSTKRHDGPVTCIVCCKSHPLAVTGGQDNVVNLIRTDNGSKVAQLRDAKGSIMALAFDASDRRFLAASFDSSISFYKLPQGIFEYRCSDNRQCVNDAKFLSDDQFISCCRDRTIKLFDFQKSTPISLFTSSSQAYSISALNGISQVITAHHDGKLRVWDFRASNMMLELPAHKSSIMQVIGFQGSSRIVSFSSDQTISVIDMRTQMIQGSVKIDEAGIHSERMQIAVYGKTAVIGGQTGELIDYDLTTFKLSRRRKGHQTPVPCVAVKPSAGLMVTGDKAGVIKFWNK
jgi:hypothetical protein